MHVEDSKKGLEIKIIKEKRLYTPYLVIAFELIWIWLKNKFIHFSFYSIIPSLFLQKAEKIPCIKIFLPTFKFFSKLWTQIESKPLLYFWDDIIYECDNNI